MTVAHTLVRRGMAVYAEHGDKIQYNVPTWGAVMLASTMLFFMAVMFMVEYTFGRVIPALLIIESPADSISFEPLATEDPDSTINDAHASRRQLSPQPCFASSVLPASAHAHALSSDSKNTQSLRS